MTALCVRSLTDSTERSSPSFPAKVLAMLTEESEALKAKLRLFLFLDELELKSGRQKTISGCIIN